MAKARPHPYLVNNAFPGTWRPHAKILSDWLLISFSAKITSCGCGYEKPHPLLCPHVFNTAVHRSNSFGPIVIQKFFICHLFSLHTNGKRCNQEGVSPFYSQSQVVYAYKVLSLLLQGFFRSKYHFWPFLGLT